jgi:quercetin dioxygenase-like cupin family protein
MKKGLWVAIASALILCAGFVTGAEKRTGMAKTPEHQMYMPADIKWVDAPPVLPAGAKAAVLEGDPHKAGYFAMRLKMPDGYKIMPHWHPNVERVTVISGTIGIGTGDTFDPSKGHEMTAGTYATMQPNVHHFAWTKGETEIQLTTIGPWKLVYVNPKDDPSKMAKK